MKRLWKSHIARPDMGVLECQRAIFAPLQYYMLNRAAGRACGHSVPSSAEGSGAYEYI